MYVNVYRFGNKPEGYWFSFSVYHNLLEYSKTKTVGGKYLYKYQIEIEHPLMYYVKRCMNAVFPLLLYRDKIGEISDDYFTNHTIYEKELANLLKKEGYDSVIFINPSCKNMNLEKTKGMIDLWLLYPLTHYFNYISGIIPAEMIRGK